jgi:hypothetical protein
VKVGDIVKQNRTLIDVRTAGRPRPASPLLGVVIAIREQAIPKENETEYLRTWMGELGRLVDVLWSNGRMTENFAEKGLDVVEEK